MIQYIAIREVRYRNNPFLSKLCIETVFFPQLRLLPPLRTSLFALLLLALRVLLLTTNTLFPSEGMVNLLGEPRRRVHV